MAKKNRQANSTPGADGTTTAAVEAADQQPADAVGATEQHPAPTTQATEPSATTPAADAPRDPAGDDALDERIKSLLQANEDKVRALPDFKAPESREDALGLLLKIGIDPRVEPDRDEPVGELLASGCVSLTGVIPAEPSTVAPAVEPSEPSDRPTAEQVAAMLEVPPAIELDKDGVELVWKDESAGRFGFAVETSHDGNFWSAEADLPAGTTRYAPVERPPSKTDFYRVAYKVAGLASSVPSNVVVIHFPYGRGHA